MAKKAMEFSQIVSIYIHWPFCTKLCNYCNFNKYVSKDSSAGSRMVKCLKKEASFLINRANASTIDTIYFGGGTPSLMSPNFIESILKKISKEAVLNSDCEVTLEVNPTKNIDISLLQDFVNSGINRFSIGVQSLDDKCLQWMNRDHDAASAIRLIDQVSRLDLRSFSIDLIFGRPDQSPESWEDELTSLFSLFPFIPHVSLYELTVEKGTALDKDVRRGKVNMPSEELRASLYQLTRKVLFKHGLSRYEISNFAKSENHRGQHNSRYWKGGSFLGLGPGAHGRYFINGRRCATVQTPLPDRWMQEVEQKGHGTAKIEHQSTYDVLAEILATSLRTEWGLEAKMMTDIPLKSLVENDPVLESMVGEGLIEVSDSSLRLSESGLAMADYITPYFLASLQRQIIY